MPPSRKQQPAEGPPTNFPAVLPPNYPSPGHDFTLQAVMHMQETVGKLVEAVESLKQQNRERDLKLDGMAKEIQAVGRDVHGAKAAGKALLWVMGVIGALVGIAIGAYLQGRFANSTPPVQAPKSAAVRAVK